MCSKLEDPEIMLCWMLPLPYSSITRLWSYAKLAIKNLDLFESAADEIVKRGQSHPRHLDNVWTFLDPYSRAACLICLKFSVSGASRCRIPGSNATEPLQHRLGLWSGCFKTSTFDGCIAAPSHRSKWFLCCSVGLVRCAIIVIFIQWFNSEAAYN